MYLQGVRGGEMLLNIVLAYIFGVTNSLGVDLDIFRKTYKWCIEVQEIVVFYIPFKTNL